MDGPDLDGLSTSPFCRPCDGSWPLTPTPAPDEFPDGTTGKAFASSTELRNAVDSYMQDRFSTDIYGFPMGNWNVGSISIFSELFSASRNPQMLYFSEDLSNWDMTSATNTDGMFEGTVSFTNTSNTLAAWDVSNVRSMSRMFASSGFQGDISQWSVKNVVDFSFMFEFAAQFNCDLSGWETSMAQNMGWMFRGAIRFDSPLPRFDIWEVTSMTNM
jgi:hypothetical protein